MKKIIYLFFTFFFVTCLTACSFLDNITTKKTKSEITILYIFDDREEYKTYNSYNDIEFLDYETATGYEFAGWSLDREIVVTKNDLKGMNEAVLHPITKLINYKISYNLDGGTNNYDNPSFYTIEDEITIKAPMKDNFAFAGWTSDTITTPMENFKIKKGSTGDITLTANYIAGKVNVVFDYDGIDMQTIDYNTKCVKPTDPIKPGDTFLYWCTDITLQNEFDFDTPVRSNITLYPRWENTNFNRLTIKNSSYVTSNHENGEILPEGVIIELSANYIDIDKAFTGWYINDSFYSKVNEITYKMPNTDLIIEPRFDDLKTYTYVKGNSNLIIEVSWPNMTLLGSNITKDDYEFIDSHLVISADYLSKLDLGLHSFLYSSNEIIRVFIEAGSDKVTNIRVDYDINYPDATLIFDEKDGLEYYYSVDGSRYLSCNSYDTFTISNKYVPHTIDIMCGTLITTYVLEEMPINAKPYLEKSFTYQGDAYDYYIDSEDDLKTLLEYETQAAYPAVGGTSYNFKFYYYYGDNELIAKSLYRKITNSLMSVPYGLSYSCGYDSKVVNMTLHSSGHFNDLETTQEKNDITNTYFKPSSRSTTYNDFYIEKCTKEQEVRSIYELENLNIGVKPIITDEKTKELYNKAKSILREYVDDSFTVYEKIKAIYDYLASYVTYDNELLKIRTNQSDYQSFTSYSALVKGIAVCDGISSAFKLLCTIEGIECIEVIGCADGTGHAWNKVKVGNVWYGVDATWSKTTYDSDGTYVSHNFFLIDETKLLEYRASSSSYHYEQGVIEAGGFVTGVNIDKTANNYLDYYDLMYYGEFDSVVSSKAEFKDMINYLMLNGINYVELKLDGITYKSILDSIESYSLYPGNYNCITLIR